MWAVLKQLLSTNWLIKSAVKREVSLVSFRNFWFLSCEDKWYDVCLVISGMSVVKWHESRHFPFLCHRFEDKQGISLTTWMVQGEIDKWNINFKFFFAIFVVRHVEWELCLKRCFAVLTWANNSVCVDCFFWHLFLWLLWRRFISFWRLVVVRPSVMRCHKNRDVRSFGRD